eukprot:11204703-Lingulodinium_polyedra.AAC.1
MRRSLFGPAFVARGERRLGAWLSVAARGVQDPRRCWERWVLTSIAIGTWRRATRTARDCTDRAMGRP